jgi:copper chaperone CopZ
MKTKHLCSFVIGLMLVASMANAQEKKEVKPKKEVVTFIVGMYCENCKAKIEKNISWEKGVKDLRVDLEKKTVTIIYNPKQTTEEVLQKAIEKLDYSCDLATSEKSTPLH